MIAALTNYLYVTLSKRDFLFWNVFFGELSKSMFGMEILRGICMWEGKEKGHGHGEHEEHENFAHEHAE
jgi:hypothetical protein